MIRLLTLSTAGAALFSLSFRPWGSGYFALAGAVLLVAVLMTERKPWRGALTAAIFWMGLGIPALEGTAARLWWGFPALLGLLSVGWILGGALFIWLRGRLSLSAALVSLPLILTAADFLMSRRWLFGEAALSLLAYTQADTPLRTVAQWSGTSTVVLGVMILAAGVYSSLTRRWRLSGLLIAPVVALTIASTLVNKAPENGAYLTVGAIQPAASQLERLLAGYDDEILVDLADIYTSLVRQAVDSGAELVVFGETVLPRNTEPSALPPPLHEMVTIAPAAIIGSVEHTGGATYNSAFAWTGREIMPIYRKISLVPIIEDRFSAGDSSAPAMIQGARAGMGVCLDSVHSDLARASVQQGAEILIFITDDSFAGFTATPHFHLRTAAIRAAETARATVFANDWGPSGLFDSQGNPVATLALGERGVLVADLPLTAVTTLFVAVGDWLGWLAIAALAALVISTHHSRAGAAARSFAPHL